MSKRVFSLFQYYIIFIDNLKVSHMYFFFFLCEAPALEQQTVQPVGYQLVQDQSGQYFLLPQNSIAG